MSLSENNYSAYEINKKILLDLLNRGKKVLNNLEMNDRSNSLEELTKRVSNDIFKVMILGEFKNGKSTFINALLGEEVLPADPVPCTAVINEIKWSEKKRAVIYFRDFKEIEHKLPEGIPESIKKYINNYKGKKIPPKEISVDEIEDYVVIPDPGKAQEESVEETPFEKVEIYWPLDFCRNGIEIIDSPGLNEHRTRNNITENFLSKVDAAVFVISSDSPVSFNELKFVNKNLRGLGHEYIFFICNKFDLIRERKRENFKRVFCSRLGIKAGNKKEQVFFISALDALEGREENDEEMIESSNILEFEEALSEFLTNKKGKAKLLQPAKELAGRIDEARDSVIPAKRKLFEISIKDLENQYDEVKPKLEQAERRKRQIIEKINMHRIELKSSITTVVEKKIYDISNNIPNWVEELEIENDVRFFKKQGLKKQAEVLAKEVSNKLAVRIEDEMREWQKKELEPMINSKMESISDDIKDSIDRFYISIDNIKMHLSGMESSQAKGPSGLERLGAAIAGWVLIAPGAGIMGAQYGFKGVLQAIGPQLGLAIGAMLIGITNPIALVAILLGGGFLHGVLKASSLTNKIKKEVGNKLVEKIRENSRINAEKCAEEVYKKTEDISNSVQSVLQSEIQAVRDMVESVLKDKREGEMEVARKKELLNQYEKDINYISKKLVNFISTIAL